MKDEQERKFLYEVMSEIISDARNVHNKYSRDKDDQFLQGKNLAYYEVLTTLKNRALSWGIEIDILEKIDLDKEIA